MKKKLPENRFERLVHKHKKKIAAVDAFFRIIGIVLVLLVLLELGSFALIKTNAFVQGVAKGDTRDPRIQEVYSGASWAEQYLKEFEGSFQFEFSPYVGYRRVPNYKSTHINLDEHANRKTWYQCPAEKNTTRIFVFGGSTVWGTGSRDRGTIPSYLARYLCNNGLSVEVTNFGEDGFGSTHQMILLYLELRKGNIPDIVIFYGGSNDVFSAYQNNEPGLPMDIANQKKAFGAIRRVNIHNLFENFRTVVGKFLPTIAKDDRSEADSFTGLYEGTHKAYMDNVHQVQLMGKTYGFTPYFYWEPVIHTKKNLSAEEKRKVTYDDLGSYDYRMRQDYAEVSKLIRTEKEIRDLTGIFDNVKRTLYLERAHVSEDGNAIIAEAIGEEILQEANPTENT